MIRYIPFLKAKRGEITALGDLAPDVKRAICPFFDFPRRAQYDETTYADQARKIATSLRKHWGGVSDFYFDDYDIEQRITVHGDHQYAHLLKAVKDLQVIPVVALNRMQHNDAVTRLKHDGVIASNTVAFRVEQADFESFENSEDQIDYELANVFKGFEEIDLILDCRFCAGKDSSEIAQYIATFAQKFCDVYDNVRRVIVTGSSILASSRDVLSTNSDCVVTRCELAIIRKARDFSTVNLTAGDYVTVSPFYSEADLDPKILQKVMTAKLTYTFENCHYFIRGSSVGNDGNEQYFGLANTLCGQSFFRGSNYSLGDLYLHQKSQCIGPKCMPATVIKPSVVAHISYMVREAKL